MPFCQNIFEKNEKNKSWENKSKMLMLSLICLKNASFWKMPVVFKLRFQVHKGVQQFKWQDLRGLLSWEDLREVFYTEKKRSSKLIRPVWEWFYAEWPSVRRRPERGLLRSEDLQNVFYMKRTWESFSLLLKRSWRALLRSEDQWEVFYAEKICERTFMLRRPVRGLLYRGGLWKALLR